MPRVGFGGVRKGLVVKISGETVIAKISGETVVAEVSGQPVRISGETVVAEVSGQPVRISGEVVKISGETVVTAPWTADVIKTGAIRSITAASGGEVLHSGPVKSVKIKALSDNTGDIYVGGSGYRPYSGFGFCLAPGEAEMMDVSNFDCVYLCATHSGDKVCFDGIA